MNKKSFIGDIRDYAHQEYIQTVRGVGYKFIAPEHEGFSEKSIYD